MAFRYSPWRWCIYFIVIIRSLHSCPWAASGSWAGCWDVQANKTQPILGSLSLHERQVQKQMSLLPCKCATISVYTHTQTQTHTYPKCYRSPTNDLSLQVHERWGIYRPFRNPEDAHEPEGSQSPEVAPKQVGQATVLGAELGQTQRTLCRKSLRRNKPARLFHAVGKTWPSE